MHKAFLLLICLPLLNACVLNRNFSEEHIAYLDSYKPIDKFDETSSKNSSSLKITYFGVSTLLFDDGENQILVDGFFTRPSLEKLFTFGVELDEYHREQIEAVIDEYNMADLLAVIAVHSHHDHAMDAPLIAEITGADLVGSDSTCKLALGLQTVQRKCYEIFNKRILRNAPLQYGNFTIKLIQTAHTKLPSIVASALGVNKPISGDFHYPARLWDYAEGESYSIHITHPSGSIVVHANSALGPRELEKIEADWLFMSVARLTSLPNSQEIFDSVAKVTSAKNIVPIHWDDFSRQTHKNLSPQKLFLGDSIEEIELLMQLNTQLDVPADTYILDFGDHVWMTNKNK